MVEEIGRAILFIGAVLVVIVSAGIAVFLVVLVSGHARLRLHERRLSGAWWADVRQRAPVHWRRRRRR